MSDRTARIAEYDKLSPDEQAAHDREERIRELAEQATLPYRWDQELGTVTVSWDMPQGTRARDLAVTIKRTKLSVSF